MTMRYFCRQAPAAAFLLALGAGAPACWAQKWELGVLGGGSIYNTVSVTNGSASGNVGFKSGPAVGAYFANNMPIV